MRGLSMIPGLVLAAFSTGGRLIVAWGHWLVSYLPTAIYNAFVAAGKFIYDFFQRVLNAGKEVWKYITDPSRWGNDASKVLDTLLADRKAVDEEGILAASKQIISDGMQQAKETSDAAFKGFKARTEALPAFNLNIPETKAPDAPPMPEAPDKIDHNWNDLLGGKAAGAQVKAAADAVMAGSADHAKRVWEAMQRSKATKAGAPSQDPQQKANSLLQRIERNTRAAQGGGTPVAAANIANSSGTVVYTMKGN